MNESKQGPNILIQNLRPAVETRMSLMQNGEFI
jgi:hypothetical protein